jgi:hypothetical protein
MGSLGREFQPQVLVTSTADFDRILDSAMPMVTGSYRTLLYRRPVSMTVDLRGYGGALRPPPSGRHP